MRSYSLRHALDSDFEFLKSVHHTTLREHIIKIWGWDEAFQDRYFHEHFHLQNVQLVSAFGSDVGYVELYRSANALSILNILILPEFQGRGLGREIIGDLVAEAASEGRFVKLGVFKVNTRARKLYEALGFRGVGETETHFLMERHRL